MTTATGAPTTGPHQADPAGQVGTPDVTDTPDASQPDDAAGADAADDDSKPDEKIGREAARYRRRLREAEAASAAAATTHAQRVTELESAHAATTATLDAQRMALVDMAIRSARFEPDAFRPHLLVALGQSGVGALLDDNGMVDVTKLGEAVRSTAAAFTPKPTGPQPNPQQGMPSRGQTATWASVIGDAARGRR